MNRSLWTTAAVGFAVAMLVGLPGCPHDDYVIEMWPHGQQLERKVVIQHVEQPQGKDAPTTTQVSTGRFTDVIPDQLDGNAGRYACYPSEFGSAYFYSERIRGNDDQAGALEAQFKAVDRLIDILLGWTKQQFGKLGDYPKLAAFLDKDLRKDLKNVAVIALMVDGSRRMPPAVGDSHGPGPLATQPDTGPDLLAAGARVIQYAVERNYLAKGDLGRLVRGIRDDSEKLPEILLNQLLTRKAGLTEKAAAEIIKELKTPAAAEAFEEYVHKSPQFAQAIADWKARQAMEKTGKEAGAGPTTKPQEPDFDDLFLTPALAAGKSLLDLGTPDEFRFTLHVGGPPVATNGFYDEKTRSIAWAFRFPKANVSVPQVCYAVWVEPNEKAQIAHFGRAGLFEQPLAEYCLWRSTLSEGEAAEWKLMLAELKPGADLKAWFANAQFAGTDKPIHGAELIWDAIKPPDSNATQPASGGKD